MEYGNTEMRANLFWVYTVRVSVKQCLGGMERDVRGSGGGRGH